MTGAADRGVGPTAYGLFVMAVKAKRIVHLVIVTAALAAFLLPQAAIAQSPLSIVVLGDSLTAGFGLAPGEAFPEQLEQALSERGHEVEVINAGVSGDTASGGLARLDWSVPEDADAVIVELGANDALRGIDPAVTREAIGEIVRQLKARGQAVLLAGMHAPRNMDDAYIEAFDSLYPEVAEAEGVLLYPFFLEGVATQAALNQGDGIHPTAEGVAVIVEAILPHVEALIEEARAAGG
jgi:acyl-CoA thioesterase I